MLKVLFLSKIYPACHLDDKSIKPGSNSIMTDRHTAEHSRAVCLGIYWPKCGVYIAHTTIKPEVSISLTEMPFLILQVNFHTSNDFVIGVSLIGIKYFISQTYMYCMKNDRGVDLIKIIQWHGICV